MVNKILKYASYLLPAVVLLGLILLISLMFKECTYKQREIDSRKLIAQLNDSLVSYRDKEGKLISKISSIEVDNMSFFKQLQVKDKTIKELQNLVKKGTIMASIVKTETRVDTIVKTKIVKYGEEDIVFETDFNLKDWVWGTVSMDKDTTAMALYIRNQYDITLSKEKDGTYVNVINHNPFSVTKEIRSVYKLPKEKKWSVNVSAGYGMTPEGLKPFVGIGLGRNLISF